ncbi:MAG: endolytic transglycosylase MltG [Firmicutes bacterium]|nr:endolytic transglycosylase MltG [Bacillota bacterium]MCM1402137.1 endolytic transglycosylase MltG [Bacteroides sp.]MCM1478036.1 endolytic transglycosylase MltG [Bacteroides sp.]
MANTKTNKKSQKPKAKGKGRLVTVIILCSVVLGCFAAGAAYVMKPHRGGTKWIYIPGGATERSVSDSIVCALGQDEANRVTTIMKMIGNNPSVAHGAYKITDGQSAWTTARNISRGRQTPVKVTWNNVRTMGQMAESVAGKLEFSADDFLLACQAELEPEGYDRATMPAAFIPDSYEFYWSTGAEDVVKKLHSYQTKFWNEERLAQAKMLGLTPNEVATIASIVEEETSKADERPKVARLYLNRLANGMPLQADPTVKFAIGDFSIRRITNEMLRTPSPYNTYKNPGLPPGPIRIAAKSTLEAVLEAPQHNYLYMCAKEDFSGYHNFAEDYNTHLANARRYQAELDRRNIH